MKESEILNKYLRNSAPYPNPNPMIDTIMTFKNIPNASMLL